MFGNNVFGNNVFGDIGGAGQVNASDSAAGSDSIAINKDLLFSDSATGTETLTNDSPTAIDSAAGADTLTLDKELPGIDSATGSETLSIYKQLSIVRMRERTRLRPVYLVEIALQNSGPTLYLSDRNITIGDTPQTYENYIHNISEIAEEIERATSEGLNPEIQIEFYNGKFQAYNYLIEIGDTYPFEGAVITIKEIYLDDDGVASVIDTIFKGALDEPRDIDLMQFSCAASSLPFWKDKQFVQAIITKADYPNADPDDLNKVINTIYGSVEQVKCHAIAAGGVDYLSEDITSGQTSFQLSDASEFPAGAITIQIESEQIRGSFSGNTFAVTTRGYNSTTAAAHDKGMSAYEVKTEYVYLVAGHPVKTIGDIYVDGVRQLSGFTKYTGQSGSEHGSYPGKAIVVFTAKPVIEKQVNLAADDTINVSNPSHAHAASLSYATLYMEDYVLNSGTWNFDPRYSFDHDFSNGADGNINSTTSFYRKSIFNTGTPARIRAMIHCGHATYDGPATLYMYINGSLINSVTIPATTSKTTYGTAWATLSGWSSVYDANTYIKLVVGGSSSLRVWETWFEVEYDPSPGSQTQNTSKTGTVTLTGNSSADVVVGSSVNCDVEGYRDDGSGTYTGSASALIERPDHVIKHFIDVLFGFTLTDIDTTSFNASGSFYASAISGGYKFGFVINEKISPLQALKELAFQCRSVLKYEKGYWYLNHIPDTAPAAIKTISKSELAGEFAKFTFKKTFSVDIQNDLTARFNENYGQLEFSESEWIGTSKTIDATSQTKYGIMPAEYDFWAITSQTMADNVLAHVKLQRKNSLLIVTFPVFWEHFDLKRGDTFDITNDLYNAKKFYIERISRLDKARLNITAIQWWI